MPVGLQIKAARGIGAKRRKYPFCKEAARAVARVDYYAHTLEGPGALGEPERGQYLPLQALRIGGHDVAEAGLGEVSRFGGFRGKRQYPLYIRLFKAGFLCEELHAVALAGQMARGDHYAAVETALRAAHEHRGGGGHAGNRGADAEEPEPRGYGARKLRPGHAGVRANGAPELVRPAPGPFGKPAPEGIANVARGLKGEVDGLAALHGEGDAADVASVLQG